MRWTYGTLAGTFLALAAAVTVALDQPVSVRSSEIQPPSTRGPVRPPVCVPVGPALPQWPVGVRRYLERMEIPMQGDELDGLLGAVDRSARRFGVDPLAVLGVIEVESRFDPAAVSPRGAMGLMQLRAATAREVAEELGLVWSSDDLLLNPDLNVFLGTCYLSRLLHRFGDLDAALDAFHVGPTRFAATGREISAPSGPPRYADRVGSAIVRLKVRPLG